MCICFLNLVIGATTLAGGRSGSSSSVGLVTAHFSVRHYAHHSDHDTNHITEINGFIEGDEAKHQYKNRLQMTQDLVSEGRCLAQHQVVGDIDTESKHARHSWRRRRR